MDKDMTTKTNVKIMIYGREATITDILYRKSEQKDAMPLGWLMNVRQNTKF